MKTIYTKVDQSQDVILDPIYMTREQWQDGLALALPTNVISRIIIVDFIEEEETEDER